MLKKWLVLLVPIVTIITIIIGYEAYDGYMEYTNNHRLVNKTLYFSIKQDDIIDYKAVKEGKLYFSALNNWAKSKMVRYMKRNNYKISIGNYEIKQGTSFSDALKIFTFEELD